jgi:hypothetical protein
MLMKDINKQYIRSEKTDVLATLKRLGWEPPSESIWMQEKWATYRNLQAINEEKTK